MKILIIGGNGMAGHMILAYLQDLGHEVRYTTRSGKKADAYHHTFDVTAGCAIDALLEETRPEVVINCVGVLNQAAEEHPARAVLVNSWFPHLLDEKSISYGYRLIHISTDCVFSGRKGRYSETDQPDAENFYGRSKALGEIVNERSLTIRTSIIGPEIRDRRIGLLDWFLQQEGTVNGYTQVIWTGVTTLQLAKSIATILHKPLTGLIHLVNNDQISKHDLLVLFARYFDRAVQIIPDDSAVSDKSLVNTRPDVDLPLPDYKTMVRELASYMKEEPLYGFGVAL